MKILRIFLLFAAMTCFAASAAAGDDIQSVAAVWSDFVAALRRGDYPSAHALFSRESRTAMPYGDFVQEYGPLSAAREMVLAKPETQSTRLDDDWAEITYGGVNPGSGRQFRVGVSLVKNDGSWALVAARNEMPERLEAGARGLLRVAAHWRGQEDARARLDDLVRLHTGKNPVMQYYRFETDNTQFKAVPLREGLRLFHVDEWGNVRAGEPGAIQTLPPDERKTAAMREPAGAGEALPGENLLPKKPIIPLLTDAMPEMAEPAAAAVFTDILPEMAEPPMQRKGEASRDSDMFALPDSID